MQPKHHQNEVNGQEDNVNNEIFLLTYLLFSNKRRNSSAALIAQSAIEQFFSQPLRVNI